MPAEPAGAGDGQAAEAGVAGDLAPEPVPAEAVTVGVAPAVKGQRGDPPGPVKAQVQLDRGRPHLEGGDDVLVGRGRPADPEPGQQGRRQPHPLGPGPAGGAAGHVGAVAGGHGDQAGQLPLHGPGPLQVAVAAGDQPGRPGRPDEALAGAEDLAGPERQPAADLDGAPHPQPGRGGQGRARGDGLGEVAAHRLGQPVQRGRAEPLRRGRPQQPALQVDGRAHAPSVVRAGRSA